ncbi:hypothetical protein RE943_03490 [Prescottella equi]|nr:hypothetical protein RE943_03490 [Prescottella equi]BDC70464.1 hypothetical protein KAREA_03790 [Prescottella equi]BDE57341.1 hypothetical protein REA19_03570 [Prescottella equi]
MNSTHDPVNGRLFYDPWDTADGDCGINRTAAEALTDRIPAASLPMPRSSEEISRELFSTR